MDLGRSIRRRSGRGKKSDGGRAARPKKGRKRSQATPKAGLGRSKPFARKRPVLRGLLIGALLALAGFGVGVGVATQLVFPMPDRPSDLRQVPDLRGSAVSDAEALVQAVGLELGRVDEVRHPLHPPDRIISQSPLPGALALSGGQVRATVSIGLLVRAAPDVLGMAGGPAAALLEGAGLLPRIDTVDSRAPRGTVLGMQPAPGEAVGVPSEVLLSVSSGPPRYLVPDLVGLSAEEALARLSNANPLGAEFSPRIQRRLSLRHGGRVIRQTPPAGDSAEASDRVEILVGTAVRRPLRSPGES